MTLLERCIHNILVVERTLGLGPDSVERKLYQAACGRWSVVEYEHS